MARKTGKRAKHDRKIQSVIKHGDVHVDDFKRPFKTERGRNAKADKNNPNNGNTGEDLFSGKKCQLCKRCFANHNSLTNHLKDAHGVTEKRARKLLAKQKLDKWVKEMDERVNGGGNGDEGGGDARADARGDAGGDSPSAKEKRGKRGLRRQGNVSNFQAMVDLLSDDENDGQGSERVSGGSRGSLLDANTPGCFYAVTPVNSGTVSSVASSVGVLTGGAKFLAPMDGCSMGGGVVNPGAVNPVLGGSLADRFAAQHQSCFQSSTMASTMDVSLADRYAEQQREAVGLGFQLFGGSSSSAAGSSLGVPNPLLGGTAAPLLGGTAAPLLGGTAAPCGTAPSRTASVAAGGNLSKSSSVSYPNCPSVPMMTPTVSVSSQFGKGAGTGTITAGQSLQRQPSSPDWTRGLVVDPSPAPTVDPTTGSRIDARPSALIPTMPASVSAPLGMGTMGTTFGTGVAQSLFGASQPSIGNIDINPARAALAASAVDDIANQMARGLPPIDDSDDDDL